MYLEFKKLTFPHIFHTLGKGVGGIMTGKMAQGNNTELNSQT